jgi:hypothetical protein
MMAIRERQEAVEEAKVSREESESMQQQSALLQLQRYYKASACSPSRVLSSRHKF